jgi:hypothetical protein
MDEYVLAARIGLNETEAFCRIEPLHSTCSHFDISKGKEGA